MDVGKRRKTGYVDGELDFTVGGVDALTAGATRAREAFPQFGGGDNQAVRDAGARRDSQGFHGAKCTGGIAGWTGSAGHCWSYPAERLELIRPSTLSLMLFDALPRDNDRITPGIVHLPNWLSPQNQAGIVRQLRDIARTLIGTPFQMSRPQLKSGQMQVFMLHLGRYWATDPYRYVAQVDGHRVPPIPTNLVILARTALSDASLYDETLVPWATSFRPDMALVNYYPPGATMGLHQDRNEDSPAPIVSVSIGDEALFRIGGTENRNKPWDEVTLASGDVIVFGGPKRLAFHGVPQTRPGTLPMALSETLSESGGMKEGLKKGRINITFRQVDL